MSAFLLLAWVAAAGQPAMHSHDGEAHAHAHDHEAHAHAHDHDHNHDHDEGEPASGMYSRRANEEATAGQDVHHYHAHEHEHHVHDRKATLEKAPVPAMVWIKALAATAVISAAPVVVLFFIPVEKNNVINEPLLKVLLSFAAGGLLGDAFLHLLPHASHSHQHGDHDHHHDHHHHSGHEAHGHDHTAEMGTGLWVLAGIVSFLLIEKAVRAIKGSGHGHSHGAAVVTSGAKKEPSEAAPKPTATSAATKGSDMATATPEPSGEIKVTYASLACTVFPARHSSERHE